MSDESEMTLVMPFVVCQTNGGPYEDLAFAAGWELGKLDAQLAAKPVSLTSTIRSASLPQGDLLAMHHGYSMRSEESADVPEWCVVAFFR